MSTPCTFDPIWEQKYRSGHQQRYPWDAVVSFVFRHAPRDRPRRDVRILEVGCGTASNLWFAAREGFRVAGVDASKSAIETARRRFADDGLEGELEVADFANLPFEAESFDLAIDRAAITCCGLTSGRQAIGEVRRVLRTGGLFFFNPYSTAHTGCAMGQSGPDGVTVNIQGGTLTDAGQICFYESDDVRGAFQGGWSLLSLKHLEIVETLDDSPTMHAEWRAVAKRI